MGVKKNSRNHIKRAKLRLSNESEGADKENQGATEDASKHQELKQRIWQTVALIPPGKVASYGQIARLCGYPAHSRFVGATLRNLPKGSTLPWFRVVNASRRISLRGGGEARQRKLMEQDGITFIGERVAKAHLWDAGD